MPLVKSFSLVVSDPKSPLRFVGKMILRGPAGDGQSSCMVKFDALSSHAILGLMTQNFKKIFCLYQVT